MSQDEQTIRLHSIISRIMLQVQTGDEILASSRSIGVPNNGYVDFVIGLMYGTTQSLFRKESGLSVREADNIFLAYWQKEGRDIRNRIIQMVEEQK